jgi:histone deacetylase 11
VKAKIVFSPRYDLSLFGLERAHPFDARKYGRAFSLLNERVGASLSARVAAPAAPASDEVLLKVHTREYLSSLGSSATVAKAIEVGVARFVPNSILRQKVLAPMRWAVAGTILAAELALEGALVMNLGGGFHHAFRDRGEGFCVYADVALAIAQLRSQGRLRADDQVMVIDLDAHRGNGFEAIVKDDPTIHVLDVYNFQIYPGLLPHSDPDQQPFMIPILAGSDDATYRDILAEDLPKFLASAADAKLAFYNAGTDIVAGDPLGRLNVSPAGVTARDRTVIDALASRGIPTVIVTSGGYTRISHKLIAETAQHLLNRFG